MRFVPFNSPRYKKTMRDERIHVFAGPPNAIAVHLVFDALGYVVNKGSLALSMAAARKLAHRVMEDYDASPRGWNPREATLSPITALQVPIVSNEGGRREYLRGLSVIARHSIDHMGRVRALAEIGCLLGAMPMED